MAASSAPADSCPVSLTPRHSTDHHTPSSSLRDSSMSAGSSEAPWMSTRTKEMRHPIERFDAELCDFVEWIRPSIDDHKARLTVVKGFESVVQSIWPASKVEVFGSLATGLYLPDGDLDVVVSLPSMPRISTRGILVDIARASASRGLADVHTVEIVDSAKVPLLRFSTLPGGDSLISFKLDVSLEHARDGPLGAAACLSILDGLDPEGKSNKRDRAKGLVFVIKTLLGAHDLATSRGGGLGGMSIFCLVVSFIQHDTRSEETCSPTTDLLAFLDSCFDYERFCISVVGQGSIQPKSTQRWTDASKRRRVCIQHPTDLNRNLACGAYKIDELKAAFGQAYEVVTALFETQTKDHPTEEGHSYLVRLFSAEHGVEVDNNVGGHASKPHESFPIELL